MTAQMILPPLLGGMLIGLAVSLMLLWNGRVTGISGIANGLLSYVKGDMAWRAAFIGGLVIGGITLKFTLPQAFQNFSERSLSMVAIAGLIVGFGTIMGSGCTSGHGVCGISRLSIRSIVATVVFMTLGIVSVAFVNHLLK